jgi:hypothetical protein
MGTVVRPRRVRVKVPVTEGVPGVMTTNWISEAGVAVVVTTRTVGVAGADCRRMVCTSSWKATVSHSTTYLVMGLPRGGGEGVEGRREWGKGGGGSRFSVLDGSTSTEQHFSNTNTRPTTPTCPRLWWVCSTTRRWTPRRSLQQTRPWGWMRAGGRAPGWAGWLGRAGQTQPRWPQTRAPSSRRPARANGNAHSTPRKWRARDRCKACYRGARTLGWAWAWAWAWARAWVRGLLDKASAFTGKVHGRRVSPATHPHHPPPRRSPAAAP